ncbi:MAG: hypothetical protein JWP89_3156 [Schlesneria sp.]|nr:hypothetical protein [Schlesneria sp.]
MQSFIDGTAKMAQCLGPTILDSTTIPILKFEISDLQSLHQHFSGLPLRSLNQLSVNMHFFEENCRKQGCFVPHRQKLS